MSPSASWSPGVTVANDGLQDSLHRYNNLGITIEEDGGLSKYPQGICHLRQSGLFHPTRLHENPLSKNTGYGPVIISILEDSEELLLSLLSTLQKIFNGNFPFVRASDVYAVWATNPQDFKKLHEGLLGHLEVQGLSPKDCNFLNILDNNTHFRTNDGSFVEAAHTKQDQIGGLHALRYLSRYYDSNPCNASVIQSSVFTNQHSGSYDEMLGDKNLRTHNTGLKVPLLQDLTPLHHALIDPWHSNQIPVLGKILDGNSAIALTQNREQITNTLNTALVTILETFNFFIRDRVPNERKKKIHTPTPEN